MHLTHQITSTSRDSIPLLLYTNHSRERYIDKDGYSCLSELSRINSLKMCNGKGRMDIDCFIASQTCDILASDTCFAALVKCSYYYSRQSKYFIKNNIADGMSCNASYFLEKSSLNQLSNCKEFIPDMCYILCLSIRSNDISEILFKINVYHPCFIRSNLLIFRVRLHHFDKCCLESRETNQSIESLNAWKYIIEKYWYSYLPIASVAKSDILYKKTKYAKQLGQPKVHIDMNLNKNKNHKHNENNKNNNANDNDGNIIRTMKRKLKGYG